MATIYVKARPGRRAFYERREISHDEFQPVPDSPYIRRLISHWEDVEVEGELPAATRSKRGGNAPTAARPRETIE